jgi:alpha-tubulin suppressor-like RCC1 family protein
MRRIIVLPAAMVVMVSVALASLTVSLAGGFGAQPANAQSAAQTGPWSWGWNAFGQLGNGTNADSNTPAQMNDLRDVTDVSAGELSSLTLKSDGTVWASGWNNYGQLGDGTNTDSNTPVQVSGLTDARAISEG